VRECALPVGSKKNEKMGNDTQTKTGEKNHDTEIRRQRNWRDELNCPLAATL
jgi:hypothetical protein